MSYASATDTGISWNDEVQNEEVREKTTLQELELIIKKRRPRWFGHILRLIGLGWARLMMVDCRTKLRTGRRTLQSNGRENWNKNSMDIVKQDLQEIGLSCEEVEEHGVDRKDWHRRVDKGRTKDKNLK